MPKRPAANASSSRPRRRHRARRPSAQRDWNEDEDGPRPVIWSPAASSWGAIVNQRLGDTDPPLVPTDFTSFMLTPLVIAMPSRWPNALGYPDTPIGWADILELSTDPGGWDSRRPPRMGPVPAGQDKPQLLHLGAERADRTDLRCDRKDERPRPARTSRTPTSSRSAPTSNLRSCTTGTPRLTFLNNWFRADQRGTSLTYASAAAVEEKSVHRLQRRQPRR